MKGSPGATASLDHTCIILHSGNDLVAALVLMSGEFTLDTWFGLQRPRALRPSLDGAHVCSVALYAEPQVVARSVWVCSKGPAF